MKKVIAAGAVLLLAGSIQLSYAGNREEGQRMSHRDWAVSGYIGMADFDGDEKPDPFRPGITHEMESEKAFKFGAILSKYYNDFSFNLGIEYIQEVTVEDENGRELSEHNHIPISLGVNYHFNTNVINPYIGVGVGYSFNDATENPTIEGISGNEALTGFGMSLELDDSIFYFLTAGIEYPVNDRYALFLAGQYTIGDADITGTVQSPRGTFEVEDEGSLDRYEVNVGVKYFF